MHQEDRPSPSVFSSNEAEQWDEPRSVSWLAVAGLVMGLLSAGALLAPLLWLLPAAGIALSLAALVALARDTDGRRLGWSAAACGLALSLLFGAWGVSNHVTRQLLVSRQAREIGQRWLTLVLEGQLQEAHQLQMHQRQRRAPGTALDDYYSRDEDARLDYHEFTRGEVLRELADLGPEAQVRFAGDEAFEITRGGVEGPTDFVTQRYVIDGHRNGSRRLAVRMVLARTREPDVAEASWRVVRFELDPVFRA
jgi:hypothetical protein